LPYAWRNDTIRMYHFKFYMNTQIINGHKITVEEGAEKGYEYMKFDLQMNESEVFFREAKRMGKADFEDDQERNFSLKYSSNGTYTLSRRP